jgi:hypothetical protein
MENLAVPPDSLFGNPGDSMPDTTLVGIESTQETHDLGLGTIPRHRLAYSFETAAR